MFAGMEKGMGPRRNRVIINEYCDGAVTRARWRSGERWEEGHDIQWSHYLSGHQWTGDIQELSWSDLCLWLRNKISTQLPRCWAALCLINDLIISNTVFQIAVTTLSLAPAGTGIASRGCRKPPGGRHRTRPRHRPTQIHEKWQEKTNMLPQQSAEPGHFIPTNFLQMIRPSLAAWELLRVSAMLSVGLGVNASNRIFILPGWG